MRAAWSVALLALLAGCGAPAPGNQPVEHPGRVDPVDLHAVTNRMAVPLAVRLGPELQTLLEVPAATAEGPGRAVPPRPDCTPDGALRVRVDLPDGPLLHWAWPGACTGAALELTLDGPASAHLGPPGTASERPTPVRSEAALEVEFGLHGTMRIVSASGGADWARMEVVDGTCADREPRPAPALAGVGGPRPLPCGLPGGLVLSDGPRPVQAGDELTFCNMAEGLYVYPQLLLVERGSGSVLAWTTFNRFPACA